MKRFMRKMSTLLLMCSLCWTAMAKKKDWTVDIELAEGLRKGHFIEKFKNQLPDLINDGVLTKEVVCKIVKDAIKRGPNRVVAIVKLAVEGIPKYADEITKIAVEMVPEQAAAINKTAAEVAIKQAAEKAAAEKAAKAAEKAAAEKAAAEKAAAEKAAKAAE